MSFILNPVAIKVDYSVLVDIETLDKMGWSFDEIVEFEYQKEGENGPLYDDYEAAKKVAFKDRYVRVNITTTENGIYTSYSIWEDEGGNTWSFGDTRHTGDDEETLKDVAKILGNSQIWKRVDSDASYDVDDICVPTFINT